MQFGTCQTLRFKFLPVSLHICFSDSLTTFAVYFSISFLFHFVNPGKTAICRNARLSGIHGIFERFSATTATTTGGSSSSRECSSAGDQQCRKFLHRNSTPVSHPCPRRVAAAVNGTQKEDNGNDAHGSFRRSSEPHQQPAFHTKLSSSTRVINACSTATATLHPAGLDNPASPEGTHRELGTHQQPSFTVRLGDANGFLLSQGGDRHEHRACCPPESDANGTLGARTAMATSQLLSRFACDASHNTRQA